jgi:hypothetical protein
MKMLRSDQHLLNLDFVEFDFEDARSPLPTLAKASHALSRAVFGFIAVAHWLGSALMISPNRLMISKGRRRPFDFRPSPKKSARVAHVGSRPHR